MLGMLGAAARRGLRRRANVQGISVGSMQMFEAMSRAIAASGIKPVLDKVFTFGEAQADDRHTRERILAKSLFA